MNRKGLVRAYIGALDACTLVILAGPDGMCGICAGPSDDPLETFWFPKLQHAEMVLAQCPEGWVDIAPAALRDEAVNAAAALGARFRTTAEVEVEAAKVVAEIIEQVETRRQNGGLAKVNRDYKTYRHAQIACGQKAVPYSTFLSNFTRSLVVLAAKNANAL